MRVNGSLSDEDVAFSLEDDHVAAWDEWDGSEDARLWDTTTTDGIAATSG
jgi:hypothetical protein